MSINTKYMGYPDANISFQEGGQVSVNSSGDGNVVVTEDGVSIGGSIRMGNKPFTPGQMFTPFPFDMFAGMASMPSAIFMPPMMDMLPKLAPVVAASAAVVALSKM